MIVREHLLLCLLHIREGILYSYRCRFIHVDAGFDYDIHVAVDVEVIYFFIFYRSRRRF